MDELAAIRMDMAGLRADLNGLHRKADEILEILRSFAREESQTQTETEPQKSEA